MVTAGDRPTSLGPRGISGPLEEILWPLLHGTVHYTGMRPMRPHLVASADRTGEATFEAERRCLVDRLDHLDDEEPIPYRTLMGGEYDEHHQLFDDVAPGRSGLAAHLRD